MMKLIIAALCCAGCTVSIDGRLDASIDVSDASIDASDTANDVSNDAAVYDGNVCCQVPVSDGGCQTDYWGCVFNCVIRDSGLTMDLPWLCYGTNEDYPCQQCSVGMRCHTVNGDGVVIECQ